MNKKYTLFFSWQSDDTKSQKILESKLQAAIDFLKENEGIDLTIDYSTLGKSGMASIDQTILEKIDACDIFLADITPLISYSKTEGNGQSVIKEMPNPNVLLELGYAMSAIGVDYVIPVAHQGKWVAANLPFDINHHTIYSFNSTNCDLVPLIQSVIAHIKQYGRHRHKAMPYFVHKFFVITEQLKDRILKREFDPYKDAAVEESTVFFKRRIGQAFPGDRGLIVYTNPIDINKHLSKLFKNPIHFKKSIIGATDPIWWFRAGSALNIDKYRWLGGRRFLIGWDELEINRIAVYSESGRYYSNYVYVESKVQKPTGLYGGYTQERINDLAGIDGDFAEEYCIYRPFWPLSIKISKQEEDDGYAKILGRIIRIDNNKREIRIRHLTKYNFIIAAKGSAFNNSTFDSTSGDYFKALLNGSCTLEKFNEYMLSFPKPHHNF